MSMTADLFYRIMNRDAEEEDSPESSRHRRGMHSTRMVQVSGKRFRSAGWPLEEEVMTRDWPLYGKMSVLGRQRSMEDAVDVQTNFCRPEISLGQPVHFFGVFDGYGGAHVLRHSKEIIILFFYKNCSFSENRV